MRTIWLILLLRDLVHILCFAIDLRAAMMDARHGQPICPCSSGEAHTIMSALIAAAHVPRFFPYADRSVACACASLLDAFPLSLPIQVSLLSCLESLDHPGNPVRPTKVWLVRSIHQLCHNHSRLG
jgi:hypothetical protein